uniref:Putative serine protease with signal anchor n=1 Tax=Ixodes ricinus TaxID=34613 RepID=A0A0K8RD55_IXORI
MGSSYFAFVAIFFTLHRISITGPRNSDTLEIACGRRQQQDIVSERIVNGSTAHADDWPWMVGLYTVDDKFYCGGVLMSNQYVLTAAHCYKDQNTTGFLSVRLGSTNRTNFTVDCHQNADHTQNLERSDAAARHGELEDQVVCMEVDDVCIPVQGNNCADFMIDLALLKLKMPVNFTKRIQPICLPENCEELPSDVSIYAAGWGRAYDDYTFSDETTGGTTDETAEYSYDTESPTEEETNVNSASEAESTLIFYDPVMLMARNIPIITNEECTRQLTRSVPKYTLCSAGGICYGDSGGPLMYQKEGRWYLAAIISALRGSCYHPVQPAIYVRVSHFVESFIENFIKHHKGSQEGGTNDLCARDEDRQKCVREFFNSYNRSIDDEISE